MHRHSLCAIALQKQHEGWKRKFLGIKKEMFFSSLYSVTAMLSHFQVTLTLAKIQSPVLFCFLSAFTFLSLQSTSGALNTEQLLDPCSQDHQDSFFS